MPPFCDVVTHILSKVHSLLTECDLITHSLPTLQSRVQERPLLIKFEKGGKVNVSLPQLLNPYKQHESPNLDNDPQSEDMKARLFSSAQYIAEKWVQDPYVDKASLSGTMLTLVLNPVSLLREATKQIVAERDQYGWEKSGANTPCTVEYDLPGPGSKFDNHHFRGLMTAGFLVNFLKSTGVLLSNYINWKDKDNLQTEPEEYLKKLHDLGTHTSGIKRDHISRQRAYTALNKLHNADPDYLKAWNEIYTAHQKVLKITIERMGYSISSKTNPSINTLDPNLERTVLSLDTDELQDGLKKNQEWYDIIEALKDGHPEAPVLNDEYEGESMPWSDEEEDSDIDSEDGNTAELPHLTQAFKPGIRLDLRLGNQFGIASLTHPCPAEMEGFGAPTPLTVEMASTLRRSREGEMTYISVSLARHHRVLLVKKCLELMGIEVSNDVRLHSSSDKRVYMRDVPFGRILGIETEVGERAGPLRWLEKAEGHLKGVSGKSTMVFRDDEDEEEDDQTELLETTTQSLSISNKNTKDTTHIEPSGPRGLGPKKAKNSAAGLAVSAMFVQIFQSKRTKDCIFDWNRVLENRKDVGLYLQYAHARLCGIQRRAGVPLDPSADLSLISQTSSAIDLASLLMQYPFALSISFKSRDPSTFIPYLVALARCISSGHNSMFVYGSREDIAKARMLLLWCAKVVINSGLRMLGLVPMERM
ncbi:Arginyl-tRNA synthetase [Chytridiales sp. JEL 0842]|nr:Arginyl-tRNA synthetase [Chytridiales sp. JEL 0842]